VIRTREPLIAAGLTLLLHTGVLVLGAPGVFAGRLVDPDCYVRLMRIERLVTTGAWWDGLMPLLDAPGGLVMHWTRLFDLVVLACSLPLMPFLDFHQALFWGGAAASPLLQVPAAMLLAWAARPYLGSRGSLLAVVLFLVQPGIYGVYQIGRADHHSLHLTLAVAVLALLLVWGIARERRYLPLLAGIAAGAGLWVGAEALMTIAVAGGGLGLAWLLKQRGSAAALWRFALGLALATLLALAAERPPGDWLAVELDRLSLVHGVLVLLLAAAAGLIVALDRWRPDASFLPRVGTAMAGGLLVLLPMALQFPQFFAGPYGAIDPQVQAVFLANVREAEPMLARGATTWADALFALGPLVAALPFAVALALRGTQRRRFGWLVLALAMLVYLAASLHQMRVLSYVELALAIPWAGAALAAGSFAMTRLVSPWRAPAAVLCVLAILLGSVLGAAWLLDARGRVASAALEDRCDWPALQDWLNRSDAAHAGALATYVFPGPWIAWATGRGVVSAPYHRNADGILDVDRLFRAGDAQAQAIAGRRGLGLIVLCPLSPGRGGHDWYLRASAPDGLYARLARGELPEWLVRLDAGDPRLADFLVFGVALP